MRRIITTAFALLLLLAPSFLMGQVRDMRPQVRLATDGLKLFRIGKDNAAAQTKLLAAIKADSTYAPAYYTLARVYMEKNVDSAIIYARKAYEIDSTNRWYLSLYAQNALATNKIELARELYYKLTHLQPKDIQTYSVLSRIHQQMGQAHTAIAVLDTAELRLGRNQYISGLKTNLLIATMQQERAVEEAKKAVEEAPHIVDFKVAYADVLAKLGRDSLAYESYKAALKSDSTNLRSLVSLAEFFESRGRQSEYLDVLGKIIDSEELSLEHKMLLINELQKNRELYQSEYIKINSFITQLLIDYPKSEKVTKLQIEHLLSGGLIVEALNVSKIHLQRNYDNYDNHRIVIDLERYLGREDSLSIYLQQAINTFPEREELSIEWSYLLTGQKRYTEAEEYFKEQLKHSSDSMQGVIWGMKGDLHQQIAATKTSDKDKQKQYKLSCKSYDEALKRNPRNEHVLNNFAYMISENSNSIKDLQKAERMSKLTIEIDSDNSTFLDTYAWILHKQGRYTEAKTHMRKALALDGTQNAEIALHFGEILFMLDENTMADFYWKKAVEWGLNKTAVEISRARAKTLKSKK